MHCMSSAHLQNSGYVAGAGAAVRELHDFLSGGIGQRSAVNEHTAELVHPAVTWTEEETA